MLQEFSGFALCVAKKRDIAEAGPPTAVSSEYRLFIPFYTSAVIKLNDKFLSEVDTDITFDFKGLCLIGIKAFALMLCLTGLHTPVYGVDNMLYSIGTHFGCGKWLEFDSSYGVGFNSTLCGNFYLQEKISNKKLYYLL